MLGFIFWEAISKSQYFSCFGQSYLSGMVTKPVRLLCYIFLLAFLDLTVHNVQEHSYHFELSDQ